MPPVTTWYLEQRAASDLRGSRALPADPDDATDADERASDGAVATAAAVRITRAERPSAEFGRFLYTAVGGDCAWTDRLAWPPEQWRAHLAGRDRELWVAYEQGTPAGYMELDGQEEGAVEIAYFGLLPDSRGRGLGGHLLAFGTARAWDLAERHPDRPATCRVWVHTCSLDGPHALANYQRRGFRVTHTTVSQ